MNSRSLTAFVFLACTVPLAIVEGCSAQTADHEDRLGAVSQALGDAGPATRGTLVVSQVYGGGGVSGSTYTNDFVELFNRSHAPVILDGLSLQVAAQGADFGTADAGTDIIPLSGTIPAGGYFLVQLAGTPIGAGLPTADILTNNAGLDQTSAKVAIATSTAPLACGGASRCPKTNIIDLVGYGAASDFEGTDKAPALDNTHSAQRKSGGCTDTDDNHADFTSLGPPVAHNSATATAECPSPPPKEAGAPPPPVEDPPLGEEVENDDAGTKKATSNSAAGGGDSGGCGVGLLGGSPLPIGAGALAAFGFLVAVRRRRRV